MAAVPLRDNLVIEGWFFGDKKGKDGKVESRQRYPVGVLPALPVEVVAKGPR